MSSKRFLGKPKAHINPKTCATEELFKMAREHPELYDKCLETMGFAYSFSQIANRAVHFDYLFAQGLIPIEYFSASESSKPETEGEK